jgi:hypothetical protein
MVLRVKQATEKSVKDLGFPIISKKVLRVFAVKADFNGAKSQFRAKAENGGTRVL